MSPVIRFQQDQQQQQFKFQQQDKVINGVRPTPLQLHKSSHVIHKSTSASSSSSSVISTACSSNTSSKHHHRNGPVIIYTQSPKVIHTQPRDFMALVQKLTGLSSVVKKCEMAPPRQVVVSEEMGQDLNLDYGLSKNNEDRSFLSEIPLFTPTGLDLFRSPSASQQQQFRFPNDPIFSPSTLDFLKTLPEC